MLHANAIVSIDTVKYSYTSLYAESNVLETISYLDSVNQLSGLNNYQSSWIIFQKGMLLSSIDQKEAAIELFDSLQQIPNSGAYSDYQLFLELGYANEDIFEFIKAEKYYFMALNACTVYDSVSIGKTFNSIGRVNYSMGIYDKSIEYLLKAHRMALRCADTNTFISTSVNLGVVYDQWGQHEKAIKIFNSGLEIAKEYNDSGYLSLLYSNIGVAYFYLGEHHLALSYYEKALQIELKNDVKNDISGSYHNIGNVYEIMGYNREALDFYLKALSIQNATQDYEGMILTLHDLGIVYGNLDEMDMAIDHLNKSLSFAIENNSVRTKMMAFSSLSQMYAKIGDHAKAYNFQIEYNTLRDSLYNSDKNREIAMQQARFDSEQQKIEIELLSKEKEVINSKISQNKIIIISFIGLTILLLIGVFVGFRLLHIKRTANTKLQEQEKQIVKITQKVINQNDTFIDNLKYGKVIQKAVMGGKSYLETWFTDTYYINQPQLIVSGDFFWSKSIGNKLYVVMSDCTGHGVPGGFMSMLGVAFLNDITTDNFKYYPNELLNNLRSRVKTALNQSDFGTQTHDGMDLACCLFDFDNSIMYFSGAHMPVWHLKDEKIVKYKGDLMPIGVCVKEKPFSVIEIPFKKGDSFYMFTDGIIDQFNKDEKRYGSRRLEKILNDTKECKFSDQKCILLDELSLWKGDSPQIDDSMFLGLKV